MNENEMEIMNEVMEPEFEVIETGDADSGISKKVVALAIAGVTAAGIAAVAFGKKLWDNHKAKKELRQPDPENPVEPTASMINEVVEK